jgi:transcriptional regulator with XRE-family HTH domain
VQHNSPLIRELIRLARERNWSRQELASRLAIHPTLLTHIQSGRRRISIDLLSRIVRAFPEVRTIRDLVLNYLLVEVPEIEEEEGRLGCIAVREDVADELPNGLRGELRSYLGTFLRSFYEGRGVCISGTDTRLLRSAAAHVIAECELRHIQALRTDANVKLSATLARAALHASLLVVERIDFASESVTDLLLRRADLVKPSIVTTAGGIEAIRDIHLVRVVRSMMRPIELVESPHPTPLAHA